MTRFAQIFTREGAGFDTGYRHDSDDFLAKCEDFSVAGWTALARSEAYADVKTSQTTAYGYVHFPEAGLTPNGRRLSRTASAQLP